MVTGPVSALRFQRSVPSLGFFFPEVIVTDCHSPAFGTEKSGIRAGSQVQRSGTGSMISQYKPKNRQPVTKQISGRKPEGVRPALQGNQCERRRCTTSPEP